MKVAYKNHSNLDQTLLGMESIRFMPGAVVEIDPEILKRYAPADVAHLKPYKAVPKPALVQPAPKAPDEIEIAGAELLALLKSANPGPQE